MPFPAVGDTSCVGVLPESGLVLGEGVGEESVRMAVPHLVFGLEPVDDGCALD